MIFIYLRRELGEPKSGAEIFRMIEKDNCFIIQHIDNKAEFYCRKAEHDLYFANFLPDTRNYVSRKISIYLGHFCMFTPGRSIFHNGIKYYDLAQCGYSLSFDTFFFAFTGWKNPPFASQRLLTGKPRNGDLVLTMRKKGLKMPSLRFYNANLIFLCVFLVGFLI